jgi:C-terminal processing protease CtpA/Prc
VNWQKQKEIYLPLVTESTTPDQLFEIMSQMIEPLNDGHVELKATSLNRYFNPEKEPVFWQEFNERQIEELFVVTSKNLKSNGFSQLKPTQTRILQYAKSREFGYLRIIELEGQNWKNFKAALADLENDFNKLNGFIIDLRDCPGGDDDVLLEILGRFVDTRRVAFHRKEKLASDRFSELETWYVEPKGAAQFTGPVVLLSNDSVFSGGDVFAMVAKALPNVTIVGKHTNGIFSYQFEGVLPNGWEYCLSNQVYYSADMVCYESTGVPVDVEVSNTQNDLKSGIDSVLAKAIEVLRAIPKSGRNDY